MNNGTVFKQGSQEIFKYTDELTAIGLDLPFSMKINQRLGFDSSFVYLRRVGQKL